MLEDLSLVRKFAYKFDLLALWHDQNSHTAWHEPWVGSELKGQPSEEEENCLRVTKTQQSGFSQVSRASREQHVHWQCWCLVCRVLTSQDLSPLFWKLLLVHRFYRHCQAGSPHGCLLFSTPHAATSCKIDI